MSHVVRFFFLVALFSISLIRPASATNEVFLSNDTAESEATYVIQFETTVTGQIDKIRIALPPDTNAANAALGRLMIETHRSQVASLPQIPIPSSWTLQSYNRSRSEPALESNSST